MIVEEFLRNKIQVLKLKKIIMNRLKIRERKKYFISWEELGQGCLKNRKSQNNNMNLNLRVLKNMK